jgi:hypothetical protein
MTNTELERIKSQWNAILKERGEKPLVEIWIVDPKAKAAKACNQAATPKDR